MEPFVKYNSIVRKIWGKSDTVLFVFAGAAAEFALNKAVDWLYYTGKLPSDPLGRLFSTVTYAKHIVFAEKKEAEKAIKSLRTIHGAVEKSRGYAIPDWAYRDVLFMLIYYSIASYELLEKKLTNDEKEEVYNVFYKVGDGMGLMDLPNSYFDWLPVRQQHLEQDLAKTDHTIDLFKQYKKHLGNFRYQVLVEAQKLLVPDIVKELLEFGETSLLGPVVPLYKFSRIMTLDKVVKAFLLPSAYKSQIKDIDVPTDYLNS